ncbi:unnamed protein product [Linum trigynum]|uniref:Uncharacterized protein n=1 Tax=Linum trigynum TaxID=586398 RepID=A0AAV2CSN0_9ROSI
MPSLDAKLTIPNFFFGSIVRSVDAHLDGRLPYGGFITLLLSNLGLSLDGYSSVETSVSVSALTVLNYIGVDPQPSKGGETLDPAAARLIKYKSKSLQLGDSSSSVRKNQIVSFEEEEAELKPKTVSEKDVRLFAEELEKDMMEGVVGTQGEDEMEGVSGSQGEPKQNSVPED